jgi:hypothetical protein
MFAYRGNLHVHSTFSDGTGSIEEIIAAAQQVGLDFLGITDHRTLEGYIRGREGKYGSVHLLIGAELGSRRSHYLAYGIHRLPPDDQGDPQSVINAVAAQGGVGFIAHPLEKGSPLVQGGRSFPWTDWQVSGFDGLEIWNFSSQWRDRARRRLSILFWFFFHRGAPVGQGPGGEVLQKWDELTRQRPVSAVAGTDAHAVPLRLGPLKGVFFPYAYLFRTLNTYVLLSEPLNPLFPKAKKQILSALQKGCCYIVNELYGRGRGFTYRAFTGTQEITMGAEAPFTPGTILQVTSPSRSSLIRLIKNGRYIQQRFGGEGSFRVEEPGVYRVEIYRRSLFGYRPWIYANPLYLRDRTISVS